MISIRLFTALALFLLTTFKVFSGETAPPTALSFRPGTNTGEGQGVAVGSNGNIYSTGQYSGTGTFGSTTLTNGGAQDYYLSAHSPSGTALWAVRAGSTLSDFGSDVIVDGDGNILVAGVVGRSVAGDTVDFNNVTNVAGLGGQDAFLAKYNSSGTLLWVRIAGSTGNDQAFDVAVDGSGNYLVSGRISGVANFSGTNIGSSGQTRAFLAKYNSSGTLAWVRDAGQMDSSATTGVAADASDNAYISGVSSSPAGPFVAKYNSSGTQQWIDVASGNAFFNENSSVAVDGNGNVYVAGRFSTASISFDSVTLSNPSSKILGYIAKYNSSGTAQWAAITGARAFDVITDGEGAVYVTGFFGPSSNGGVTVGGDTLTTTSGLDAYVAKFTNTGALAWVQYGGTSANDLGRAITLSASGSIFITGEGGTDLFDGFPGGVFITEFRPAPTHPTLTISIVGPDMIISWESIFTGFTIETTTDLNSPFAPTALSFAEVVGQPNTYSIAKPSGSLFIRLKK